MGSLTRARNRFEKAGMMDAPIHVSLVMGVASGMPCNPDWVELLVKELAPGTHWQTIAIGREKQVWPTLRRTAELGGNVRSGMEDTFYLPDGSQAQSSGELIDALVKICREVGREPANPEETKVLMGMAS
jgi:3-keto-5-aminohexanoate cleavage enzyme